MQLPLSIREVKPHYTAERIVGKYRPDGLPDGVHTGGVYRYEGEIWKPLDGRPYANADFHTPTLEAVFLDEMGDLYSFPRNWRVEERNRRQWLVRPEVYVLQDERDLRGLDKEVLLQIERDVREANMRDWEVNDHFLIGLTKREYQYFILDCSSAQKLETKLSAYQADEYDRIKRFFKLCGFENLAKLRDGARHVVSPLEFWDRHPELEPCEWKHIYASFNRPFSLLWADLPVDVIIEHQQANWSEMIPHSWVVSKEPLPEEKLQSYELTWGYSKLERNR